MWSARCPGAKVFGRVWSPGSIREDRNDFLSLRSSVGGQSAGFGALWEGTLRVREARCPVEGKQNYTAVTVTAISGADAGRCSF